jgi:LPXTG-motif cell wall-anchored protein
VESSAAVAKAAAADKDGEDEDAEGDTKVEKKKIEKASQPIVEKLNGKTVPAALVAAPVANPASATAGSTPGIALPVVGLLALAGIGYVFARRRKIQGYRHIQIVETASLGPKRALVVARVGEQTLILGSSEAGITLLRTQTDERAAGVVEATLPTNEIDVPISDALADIPEPSVEIPTALARPGFRAIEGGLASLFGKRGDAKRATDLRETQSTGDESFDDILEDSVEDQELRRKLAAGLSARAR